MSDTPLSHDIEGADEGELSFCGLPFCAVDQPERFLPSGPAHPPTSSPRDAFDFEFSTSPAISTVDSFLFCGRSIPSDDRECRVDSPLLHPDSFGPRDRVKLRFTSGHVLQSNSLLRGMRSSSSAALATACARSSSLSRRHRALIGIPKFPMRMELSDIRKRQGRRAPVPLFPVAEGGKEVVAGGRSGGNRSPLRPLQSKSHLVNALAMASRGCIPHA